MKQLLVLFASILLYSCSETKSDCIACDQCGSNLNVKEVSLEDAVAQSKNSNKVLEDSTELKESIARIEEKYGEQWDFCKCVVLNDSIDKAIKSGNTSDNLIERWDYIDKKCQVFRIQDPNRTPEEREAHERRVKKCLKESGIRH
jgi:hypothetical protein